MNGVAETTKVGYLVGFFECQACDGCPTNKLSWSDIEDKYPMMYVQGESVIVHVVDHDVEFKCRDKMYVANFSDWLVEEDDAHEGGYYSNEEEHGLMLMTVVEREALYTKKEIRKAREAREFLKVMGYPSEKEAVCLVQDGNVVNIPHTAEDVRRF